MPVLRFARYMVSGINLQTWSSMRLITRIVIALAVALLPLMTLWCVLFSITLVREINDEADETLEEYASLIISRCREGRSLPSLNSGSYNSYIIEPVSEEQASAYLVPQFYDEEVFVPEHDETEPARVMEVAFMNYDGRYLLLKVAHPTFEKDDLVETILHWIASLFAILIIVVIVVAALSVRGTLRPLYALLGWLDSYVPGHSHTRVPNDTAIREFQYLNTAAQRAVDRSEELLDRQRQFISNASHELQTPLAVIGNRVEHIINNTNPSEEQLRELLKIDKTLRNSIRINRTLMQLFRIDSGEVAESSDVDVVQIVRDVVANCQEIYASKAIECRVSCVEMLILHANESLVQSMVLNIIKNAFIHTEAEGSIDVMLGNGYFEVVNSGVKALDYSRVFDRFYTDTSREGSTGLGLAIVKSICDHYGYDVCYSYDSGKHKFSIGFAK